MRSGRAVILTLLLALLAIVPVAAADAGPAPLGEFVPASPPWPAPQASFADAQGKTLSLADFAGRLVLVNFWATWCAPCRKEMPSLERLQTRLGDKITILAISEDSGGQKAVAPFVARFGITALRTYLDPTSAVGRAFKVDGLPTSFLVDRQGRVLGQVVGEARWDSPKMLSVIEPLLRQEEIVKTSAPPAHPQPAHF
jgi:thiol-disulfide isomerase/thioredoxin